LLNKGEKAWTLVEWRERINKFVENI